MNRHILLVFVGLLMLAALEISAQEKISAQETAFIPDEAGYHKQLKPFMVKYCDKCHNNTKAEGEFSISRDLSANVSDPATKAKWSEVVNVLNSHEMPPEDEPQPKAEEVAKIVEWVTGEVTKAELLKRETSVVLRRLNRIEYKNTIRDLTGVEFDVSGFPQDPPTGGFDNIGKALTFSPLHVELYYEAALKILDQGLLNGKKPSEIKWKFEIDQGDSDKYRVQIDKQNKPIVNGGQNRVENGFKVMHHDVWNRKLRVRDLHVATPGNYQINILAGSKIPTRAEVIKSAKSLIEERIKKEVAKNPAREKSIREGKKLDYEHFETSRIYNYGPARMKVILHSGGQPTVLAEIDVAASHTKPKIFALDAYLTTEQAAIEIEYAYDIPVTMENFSIQDHDDFARPELWVDWIELAGPVNETWPPASFEKILGKSKSKDEHAGAKDALMSFMKRAYRRPVTAAEVDERLAVYQEERKSGSTSEEALKLTLATVLVSPNFLYLSEPVTQAGADAQKLNAHQIANRLSYFLWSSMPDEELFRLADQGDLLQPAVIKQQITRMLKDEKSRELVYQFAGQWLGLRDVGANPPVKELYPEYDRHLELSIIKESEEFFATILNEGLSIKNFIDSDFMVINERLARFYGVPGVDGDEFRKVKIPSGIHRGGVMTQASILSITSNGTRTSPVKRGTWVMKTILGTDPGLPVANAGEIAPKVPGIDKATVRQRLEIHRELPQCARCHSKIDPLGFALENYDAAGQWRTQEANGLRGQIKKNDPPIDPTSKLPDGTPIKGIADLKRALLQQDELFYASLSRKMMTYACGRELGLSDETHIKKIVSDLNKPGKDTLPQLIESIVLSEPFQSK